MKKIFDMIDLVVLAKIALMLLIIHAIALFFVPLPIKVVEMPDSITIEGTIGTTIDTAKGNPVDVNVDLL